MRTYDTIPDENTLRRDVLSTTMRPTGGVLPRPIAGGYEVVANLHGLLRGVDAAAVYLIPAFHRPHRTARPAQLIAVTGVRRGNRVEWCEGVVGEVVT